MRWKTFVIAAALLAAAAVPLAAQAGTAQDRPGGHARLLHRVVRLDRKTVRLDRRTIRVDRRTIRADRRAVRVVRGKTTQAHGAWLAGSVTTASSTSVGVDVLWTGPKDVQLKGQTVTVALDASTKIVYGKGQSSIDPGDLVRVLATSGDSTLSTLTAKRIHVDCNCHWIGGTITSIGSTLVVHAARTGPYDGVLKGHDVTLQLNGSTTYIEGRNKTPITLSNLKDGDKVGVVFSASGFFKDPSFDPRTATFTALRVHYWPGNATPSVSSDAGAAAGTTSP